ncbi:MAG: glycosyltransferase [Candidatus Saccharibacteria bacterium]
MKVAIAYDWLNVKHGGGEDTLAQIAELYPNADIFCLIYNRKKFGELFGNRNITTSSLQNFPSFIKKRPQLLLPFIKRAVNNLDFTGYDLVISVSSAWVKNITVPGSTKHVSYCFSPARMLWDSWPAYIEEKNFTTPIVGPMLKFFVINLVSNLRLWDYYSSAGVDSFIAISNHVADRIEKFYGRKSVVLYPPVKIATTLKPKLVSEPYYLMVSVLASYKNIELAIEAFKLNKKRLLIAGDGPDRQRLMGLVAAPDSKIEFLGRISESEKYSLLAGAQAFIFTSIEDFGIAPVEAMSQGTPVIALKGGGLNETVKDGVTGVFYSDATPQSLNRAITKLSSLKLSRQRIIRSVDKFSNKNFSNNFKAAINKLVVK